MTDVELSALELSRQELVIPDKYPGTHELRVEVTRGKRDEPNVEVWVEPKFGNKRRWYSLAVTDRNPRWNWYGNVGQVRRGWASWAEVGNAAGLTDEELRVFVEGIERGVEGCYFLVEAARDTREYEVEKATARLEQERRYYEQARDSFLEPVAERHELLSLLRAGGTDDVPRSLSRFRGKLKEYRGHASTGVVYFLLDGDEVVYVGKSLEHPSSRVRSHRKDKTFSRVLYLQTMNESDALSAEAQLIKQLQPKYNGQNPQFVAKAQAE